MKIEVKVIPKARRALIKEEAEGWKIYLTQPPSDGKANQALIAVLAEYFHVKKDDISIIKGLQSRRKTININL